MQYLGFRRKKNGDIWRIWEDYDAVEQALAEHVLEHIEYVLYWMEHLYVDNCPGYAEPGSEGKGGFRICPVQRGREGVKAWIGNLLWRLDIMRKCKKCGKEVEDNVKFCPECGQSLFDEDFHTDIHSETINSGEGEYVAQKAKTWKMVSGIISIIFFFVVSFQSCAVGMANTLLENEEVSGTAGFLVAVLTLAGGIVSLATNKSPENGSIAMTVLFGLGALIGFTGAGSYEDLYIWSVWCIICAVMSLVFRKKAQNAG